MDAKTNSLLEGYLTEPELARELKRSRRTLIRWRIDREGPPVTFLGRKPIYNLNSAREWLKSREHQMPRASKRR